jgi:dihydroorotate dehydrogenase (NAD+) catalytic subunit
MAIEITRPGKHSLIVETPIMAAAGILGFGDAYRDLINFEKLGAFITNPVTYQPWLPATGARVVPLDAGVLVHTGLPNSGLSGVLARYRETWKALALPVILHVVATTIDHLRRCAERIEHEDAVDAVELGLHDDVSRQDAEKLVKAIAQTMEKPLLVRLPLFDAVDLARGVADAGAGSLVVAAPPRGTARDPHTRQLVSGRVYGPILKPLTLRLVGQLASRVDVPIVGAGGVHSPADARDFIEAGARAVQVDTVTWVQPSLLEVIARDLGGLVVTRASGALGDEWHAGMGETERHQIEEEKRWRRPPTDSH